MRDAFGGAFMIKIFLVFIFVYICFTAIALNYAKAFKVKNAVVEYIESNEIVDFTRIDIANELDNYFENEILGKMNYRGTVDCNEDNLVYCENGIKIKKMSKAQNTEGVYYKVTTTFGWDIGFLKMLTSLNGNNQNQDSPTGMWKITGETRLIVNQ